jgi:hypothetical protein
MATRAWTVWGLGAALASGLATAAKPPELPGNPQVDGKVPPPLTQEHYQVEVLPSPRLLPESVLDPKPRHGPATAGRRWTENVIGLEVPEWQLPMLEDLDVPIRMTSIGRDIRAQPADWMTLLAFARAELHFDACETDDAHRWYRAVIERAPLSRYAHIARERLFLGKVIPAGQNQSREPPLADPAALPKPIPATANGPID